ncbi:hypothetical protein [Streptomyces virginiae]|uniref:hypothetical protein n=1 Tax=Streptomyces virginiae TaxID=1961 RepID=UPI0036FD85C9
MAAAAAVVTVGAGLGLRAVAAGAVAKHGGGALHTVLLPALVALAAPRWTPLRAARPPRPCPRRTKVRCPGVRRGAGPGELR